MITYIIQLLNGKTINAVGHKEKVKELKENDGSRVVGKERDDSKNPPVVRPAVKPVPVAETPAEEPEEKEEETKPASKKKATVKKKAVTKKRPTTRKKAEKVDLPEEKPEEKDTPEKGTYAWYVDNDQKDD